VWLAEKAFASAMLGSLALVVSHGTRLSGRRFVCHDLHLEEPDHIETIARREMLARPSVKLLRWKSPPWR